MEIRQLEYVIAVAEERHFTRAADRLLVSQSGLSASVRALERELGARLFLRNTRSVELTEAGRALVAEARRTLAGMRAAREAVAAVQGLLRGTLAVGTEQCVGAVNVSALLAGFRTRYPGVEIRLRQGGSQSLAEDVAAGRLDLAFVALCGRQPPPGVRSLPLAEEPMVLLCPPGHALSGRERAEWAELSGETFIDFAPDWGARALNDRSFAAAGVSRTVGLEVNDVHSLLDLLGHGLGIALVPRHIARKPQAAALTVVRLPPSATPVWTASVAAPAPDATGPAAQRLLGLVPGLAAEGRRDERGQKAREGRADRAGPA
ncbi:LysR family transcriptional regulator [Streptomyces johnsoniae]|uniref:LysR family transcriptional regulator n=1 Tax=Streptomyces johnsoniae TaxID=3075532 RepID=A0ABU2S6P3_9ACTN|nr:LysR family transcriptional regulator [Streptomyces sp. DSM 41886]MDT0444638.1 LysR family transcriptional regulator [Streptomyces sp. DSM 41886]